MKLATAQVDALQLPGEERDGGTRGRRPRRLRKRRGAGRMWRTGALAWPGRDRGATEAKRRSAQSAPEGGQTQATWVRVLVDWNGLDGLRSPRGGPSCGRIIPPFPLPPNHHLQRKGPLRGQILPYV
eukprot:scaffold24017_cov118-Isochrysis_galbana.AAC.8